MILSEDSGPRKQCTEFCVDVHEYFCHPLRKRYSVFTTFSEGPETLKQLRTKMIFLLWQLQEL